MQEILSNILDRIWGLIFYFVLFIGFFITTIVLGKEKGFVTDARHFLKILLHVFFKYLTIFVGVTFLITFLLIIFSKK
jgi:hypothetical protein